MGLVQSRGPHSRSDESDSSVFLLAGEFRVPIYNAGVYPELRGTACRWPFSQLV